MRKQELKDLLQRYSNNTLSPKEEKDLEEMLINNPVQRDWDWDSINDKENQKNEIQERIEEELFSGQRKSRKNLTIYWGIAASLFIGVAVAFFLKNNILNNPEVLIVNERVSTLYDGVILTLENGKTIQLDDFSDGYIHHEGNQSIEKDGINIIFHNPSNGNGKLVKNTGMNTISVPNGKHISLILTDGTKVMLNAASTFSYPVAFDVNERKTFLNGEAFFEVAKNKKKPFIVMAHDTEILVTGTKFNVSAYTSDEKVTTTLMEGGVNIKQKDNTIKLKPGSQAITYSEKRDIKQHEVNPIESAAWKENVFVFYNQDIVSIMRNISRWYGIEVIFEGNISNKKLGGTFPINGNLNELLGDLQTLTGLKIVRKGKEVRIMS